MKHILPSPKKNISMIGYALRSRAGTHRICLSCLRLSHDSVKHHHLLVQSLKSKSFSSTASSKKESSIVEASAASEEADIASTISILEKKTVKPLAKRKAQQKGKTATRGSPGRTLAQRKAPRTSARRSQPPGKVKKIKQEDCNDKDDASRNDNDTSQNTKGTSNEKTTANKKGHSKNTEKKETEKQTAKPPLVRQIYSDLPAKLFQLNRALGIHTPKDESSSAAQVPVPSARDELVAKLKDVANHKSRLQTKRVILELLSTDAFSPSGRSLMLNKLRNALISTVPLNIEDVLSEATAQGGVFESGVSIKEAMQGSGSEQGGHGEKPPQTLQNVMRNPLYQNHEIRSVDATALVLEPHDKQQPPVPGLAYGLDRALFNPGVYHLRDPRSRVYNFDPYLATIMPVNEFDFNALKEYITSSRDTALIDTAKELKKKYTGSTSSMTAVLSHFHYLLSQWREPNVQNLSKSFPASPLSFSGVQRAPAAIFLRYKDGVYAIDADKHYDAPTVLMMLGKSMEKLLTLPKEAYEKYHKSRSNEITADERDEKESFHYTTMGDFLMRSQLDAYDPRIPGTGMFDLKTRAVYSVRMDSENYTNGQGYEIQGRHGTYHSFEREYFDMIRSAFLKYSLQVRMGRMDGIYVAFHNTERIFGFQYISLPEMDQAIHGTEDLTTGDAEFKLSLDLLNRVLDRATARYPGQSLRIHFEARESNKQPFMYIFATPVTEDEIETLQTANKAQILKFEKAVMGLHGGVGEVLEEDERAEAVDEAGRAEWEALQAEVEEQIQDDELIEQDVGQAGEPNAAIEENTILAITREEEDADRRLNELLREVSEAEVKSDESTTSQTPGTAEPSSTRDLSDTSSVTARGLSEATFKEETGNKVMPANPLTSKSKTKTKPHKTVKEGSSEGTGYPEDDEDLLAMYLTVRNKVDNEYVKRPEALTEDQNWTVEYALAQIPTESKGRILYNTVLKRRASVLTSRQRGEDSHHQREFRQVLKQLAEKGRNFRAKENAKDEIEGIKIYKEMACDVGMREETQADNAAKQAALHEASRMKL